MKKNTGAQKRDFNPRPRKEGDGVAVLMQICDIDISIHALVKRATCLKLRLYQSCMISIHALVKRATTPPKLYVTFLQISIHALVKRATYDMPTIYCEQQISIHALVKRATSETFNTLSIRFYFNPRPRKEGDRKRSCCTGNTAISIHALVKRATIADREPQLCLLLFQSTPS